MTGIAENLRELRREKGYTQEDVAMAVHVSTQSVNKWERAESSPDIDLQPALANLFSCSVDRLLGMEGSILRRSAAPSSAGRTRCLPP